MKLSQYVETFAKCIEVGFSTSKIRLKSRRRHTSTKIINGWN